MKVEISMELAGKLAGKNPDELKAALYEGDGDELKPRGDADDVFHSLVLDKFKSAERDRVKGEVGRAIRERMEELESHVKPVFEQYGIRFDRLEDGLKKLSEEIPGTPPTGEEAKELTPEAIKKLPTFQSILDEELSAQKQQYEQHVQEWRSKYEGLTREQVLSKARERALSVLDGKNAVWGEDKAKQLQYFFRAVGTDHIKLDDEGNIMLTDADGNPARDDARNRVSFDNWVLNNWKEVGYTFHEAPPGSGSAGAQRRSAAGNGKIAISSPEQFEEMLKGAGTDRAKRAQIMEAWAEYQKQ